MTIQLTPHAERLLQEQLARTHQSPEQVIEHALEVLAEKAATPPATSEPQAPKRQWPPGRKSLAQLFAESPFKGLDLDFERDQDLGRDIDL